MEELLLLLRVFQERKIKQFAGVYRIQQRLNPYNPLSYLYIIIEFILSIFLYGILGTFKNISNPFKYR